MSRNKKIVEVNQKKNKTEIDSEIDKNKENEENKENKKNKSLISEKNSDENLEEKNEEKEKNEYPDIIINYMSNGKSEFEQIFKTEDNISNLFDVLLEKKSKYAEYDLITNEKINLSSKLNEKITNIFPNTENAEVNLLYLGLDINEDIKSEYESSFDLIGSPLFNLGDKFGILIYHVKENIFSSEIIDNKVLTKFNNLSAICNMRNIMYISGGEEKNKNSTKSINLFYSINLLNKNKIEELPSLNIGRSFHSMIYIPNKYIFIIGGGTNEVELYDTKKNSISIDSKMKEIRNECTLFVMNNSILYAFCGVSPEGSFLTTVEKCNLRQKERSWSYVNYNTADNTLFEDCYYIGHFFSDTSLILFAANEGEKNEYANILFDLEYEDNPTISYYEGGEKIVDVASEKIFHPVRDNNAIMIPYITTSAKIYKIDENMKLSMEIFNDAMKDLI